MPKAYDLLMQGRGEDLWQMCCGYINLDMKQFMDIQERLLIKQMELLNKSELGRKLFRGKKPETMAEFRRLVQLTSYKDYCPELLEKQEDKLPAKPAYWVRSSGRSGDYHCKWVPISQEYVEELSKILYGVGTISSAQHKGDISRMPDKMKLFYSVAPKPYISGTFADVLQLQSPFTYLPAIKDAEEMTFEDRISLGFQQALDKGLDYFFGLSLVLVKVGEKMQDQSKHINLLPYLKHPRGLMRLAKGYIKSKIARRSLMPKDIWDVKGIIGSGIDSWVYKAKIKELWGRNPLDLYSCTEGGIVATQTWDYNTMTFIPSLNLLEFLPEEEQLKLNMDRTYIPKTLLLNEVKAGESYEIVLTSFHGGSLVRYRVGDVVKIVSLYNKATGIQTPQMAFDRRTDGIIDLAVIRLTEKTLWQVMENTGIQYQDWVAYKAPGVQVLNLFIEMKQDYAGSFEELEKFIYKGIMSTNETNVEDMYDFKVKIHFLEKGFFADYSLQRQKEGADLAHIKPPHLNPRGEILARLMGEEETIEVVKTRVKTAPATEKEGIKSTPKA